LGASRSSLSFPGVAFWRGIGEDVEVCGSGRAGFRTKAETGRVIRGFLGGDSKVTGSVVVEALLFRRVDESEVLDALVRESSNLWNLRFVVSIAYVILRLKEPTLFLGQNVFLGDDVDQNN